MGTRQYRCTVGVNGVKVRYDDISRVVVGGITEAWFRVRDPDTLDPTIVAQTTGLV